MKVYKQLWYQKNRTKSLKRAKLYRKNNKQEVREYKSEWRKTIVSRFGSYKGGAKKRKLKFSLSIQFFSDNWNKECAYCGEEIQGIGLDRIDNSKGYTEDNVANCCEMCNRMKLTYSKQDFIYKCKQIYDNAKRRQNRKRS